MSYISRLEQSTTTANSKLLPPTFDLILMRQGQRKIGEPHGPQRRPKSGDFKILAAYVAAYVGALIPKHEYQRFITKAGERLWKKTLRQACDMHWQPRQYRDFDELSTAEWITMRDFVGRAYPFIMRYFDGGWLIKWALRTTWANRKKAAVRADKGMYNLYITTKRSFWITRREAIERDKRHADGILSEEDMPRPTPYVTRQPRGSKLGESLYCIGECRRMLSIDQFPTDHVGVCNQCVYTISRQQRCPSFNESDSDQGASTQTRYSSPARKRPREPTPRQPRKYRHSTLSSSVTGISDAGCYDSGRSTYGQSKRAGINKNKHQRLKLPSRPVHQLPHGSVNEQLNVVENRLQYLDVDKVASSRKQPPKVHASQSTQAADNRTRRKTPYSDPESELEGEVPLTYGFPHKSNTHVDACLTQICEAWDVQELIKVFPLDIWPNNGTVWKLQVLQIFVNMARQYSTPKCRDGISGKFTQLVKLRRQRYPHTAKTQWTLQDALTTEHWAKKEYGTPAAELQQLRNTNHCSQDGHRASQRKAAPTKRLIDALQSSARGNAPQPQNTKRAMSEEPLAYIVSSDDSGSTGYDSDE